MWPINHPRLDPALVAFGLWAHQLRRSALLSQAALAARVGCSQSTISRIEHGLLPGIALGRAVLILDALDALPCMDRAIALLARESATPPPPRVVDEAKILALIEEIGVDEFMRRWIG